MSMNQNKDIVYVITGLNRAGAELVCLSQATYFAAQGYRVAVVYMHQGHDELAPDFRAAGVEVACLGMRSALMLPLGLWRLRRILMAWKPRIVHSHMIHANILAAMVKPLCRGFRLAWTAHNVNEGGHLLNTLLRLTNGSPDLATNVSEEATVDYVSRHLFREAVAQCIPNGVDVRRFDLKMPIRAKATGDNFVFVCVAQFRQQKNHAGLLRAFAEVYRHRSRARLLLLGDGPLRAPSEDLAKEFGIADAVTFAGGNADVREALRESDAFILVSHYEGFGLAPAEAMAVGLPVIGSDVPGLREVIGQHGRLVDPRDVGAIAAAMVAQMDQADTASQSEARRTHIVSRYSKDAALARWNAEYQRLGL